MLRKLYTGSALLICAAAFAQVGINTDTPAATFDVVGKPTVTTSLDGIIAPRIDGTQLRAKSYTTAQTGAMVYVTAADTAPAGQTVNVTSPGYYYFDGSVWVKSASGGGSDADGVIGNEVLNATTNGGLVRAGSGTTTDPYTLGLTAGTTAGDLMTWNGTAWIPNAAQNIYNANGSLTSFRTLNLNSNSLLFKGQNQSTLFADDGVTQTGLTGPAVIKLQAADVNGNGETTRFAIQANEDDYVSLYSNGESKGITIETADTTGPSFIEFRTTTGPGNNQRMLITGSGNTGINTSNPSEKLDLNGVSRIRQLPLNGSTNAINTNSSGNPSSAQDQTFNATRIVVADANGVLGSVTGLPLTTEVDGVIGNEVLNATTNGGLVRAGAGTAASPYTLGLTAGTTAGQLMTWNGTTWTPTAAAEPWYNVSTNTGATANTQSIYQMGRVGVNTTTPTEMIDNNGTTRLRNLPLNGTPNSINTTSAGAPSAAQDQTFTATRTLVADANGVVGYVNSVPTSSSTDATRFLGGTVYSRYATTSGGTLPAARIIGGAAGTSYTVGSANNTSSAGGINSVIGNGYTISNPSAGLFDIRFNTAMTEIYGISVNVVDAYGTTSGSPLLNPDPNTAGSVLRTNDNAQVSFISNSIIRIKTGDQNGILSNRAFTFLVTGK